MKEAELRVTLTGKTPCPGPSGRPWGFLSVSGMTGPPAAVGWHTLGGESDRRGGSVLGAGTDGPWICSWWGVCFQRGSIGYCPRQRAQREPGHPKPRTGLLGAPTTRPDVSVRRSPEQWAELSSGFSVNWASSPSACDSRGSGSRSAGIGMFQIQCSWEHTACSHRERALCSHGTKQHVRTERRVGGSVGERGRGGEDGGSQLSSRGRRWEVRFS